MNLTQSKGEEMFDNVAVLKKSMLNFIDNRTDFGNVIYGNQNDNDTMASNNTLDYEFEPREYIFDRKEVRIIFITLYTLVFCCCFFGE